MNNDLINGIFESVGGLVMWLNVYKIFKDKIVRGFYLPCCVFFGVWSLWNLYYYPCLNQPFSFIGGVCLASGNCVWLFLAFYFKLTNK